MSYLNKQSRNNGRELVGSAVFFASLSLVVLSILLVLPNILAADPQGPDDLSLISNETKASVSAQSINISGGRIATFNLNATVQNPRWKGFVGNVSGQFTLDDASGSTLFDWSVSSITGQVYATRTSSSVTWSSINCSNGTTLSQEDISMNHSNSDDNISATFNATNLSITTGFGSHSALTVGSISIPADNCPTINTYVNNVTQDADFEEIALYDNTNIVYSSILEQDQTGFDTNTYDFQMIVPENGLPTFTSSTAYYIYVELGV